MTQRATIKYIRFAAAYGQSAPAIAERLNIPVEEVKRIILLSVSNNPTLRRFLHKKGPEP